MSKESFCLNPEPWVKTAINTSDEAVKTALYMESPEIKELAILLSPVASGFLEELAQRALTLTRRYWGRTISLYVPLYLSNYCTGGCAYCGFSSDRKQPRHKLSTKELLSEITTLKKMGFEDVLLLTGEKSSEADFDYLLNSVSLAIKYFHNVTVESFAMTTEEYHLLAKAGCTGITLYQETYDPVIYKQLHRWGAKRNYKFRFEAPLRAFSAGLRTVGLGVLIGLTDPVYDAICLFQYIQHLRKIFWQGGVLISFPRVCLQQGDFKATYHVSDKFLAQMIFAFRICMPDVPLVLSTREKPIFRDGMAGVGISRMSVGSKTTVGGYANNKESVNGQFDIMDTRDVNTFCNVLKSKGLEPVFKNWDAVFQKEITL